MKKALVSTLMILGLVLGGTTAFAGSCDAVGNTYTMDGYLLYNWVPQQALYSPAPQCEGQVTLISPGGISQELHYVGTSGALYIVGIPCEVVSGDLRCDAVVHNYFTFKRIAK